MEVQQNSSEIPGLILSFGLLSECFQVRSSSLNVLLKSVRFLFLDRNARKVDLVC